jgi:hypothetical protein
MSLLIIIGLFLAWWFAVETTKELHTRAKDRRDERIMAAHESVEEARAYNYPLEAIECARLNGLQELHRIAAEARSEVIEGTAVEVKPGKR